MRADAQRNRERLLEAAKALFASRGLAAPLDEVAAAAGLGIATLYRHFPSREELVSALVESTLEPIAEHTREQAADDRDPRDAFVTMMTVGVERHVHDLALCQLWRNVDNSIVTAVAWRLGLFSATARVLERAQACGAVRSDVQVEDVVRVFYAAAGVIEAGQGGAWQRFLALQLRGMLATEIALPTPGR